jgi:hypothetical protein
MNNNEINAALSALNESLFLLEEEYMENGGEVTESTEQKEQNIEYLKALLEDEGIDSLGRWLKSKEDLIKTLKAEKDSVTRQIKKTEDRIEYIKSQIHKVLTAIGKDKVKGTFYSFAPTVSRKTEVDNKLLEKIYLEKVTKAVKKILPAWVSCKLSASVSAVPEGTELPEYFKVNETQTCSFTKPRASKKSKSEEDK